MLLTLGFEFHVNNDPKAGSGKGTEVTDFRGGDGSFQSACEPGTARRAALLLPLLRKDPRSVWPAPPELSSVLACRAVRPEQEREGPSLLEARLEAASPLEERARGANFPEGSDTALKGCLRHMGDSGRAWAWG